MRTTDRVVCAVVVKPAVQRPPNDVTNRKSGQIYTDMIALEDKFYILQFAFGGTRELAPFPSGQGPNVGSVQPRKSTSRATKRAPRRR